MFRLNEIVQISTGKLGYGNILSKKTAGKIVGKYLQDGYSVELIEKQEERR